MELKWTLVFLVTLVAVGVVSQAVVNPVEVISELETNCTDPNNCTSTDLKSEEKSIEELIKEVSEDTDPTTGVLTNEETLTNVSSTIDTTTVGTKAETTTAEAISITVDKPSVPPSSKPISPKPYIPPSSKPPVHPPASTTNKAVSTTIKATQPSVIL